MGVYKFPSTLTNCPQDWYACWVQPLYRKYYNTDNESRISCIDLEPIPKMADKHIAWEVLSKYVTYRRIKYLPTVRKIPDKLWNEIRLVLPPEKSNNTIGRPVIPYRKVLDGILYVLITGCQWKMLPKEYGSGSTTCHRRFQEWVLSNVFQKLWVRLLKLYDDLRGIKWTWQLITW